MTRRRAILAGAAATCLFLAVVAALLARDVRARQSALRSGDVRAASGQGSWNATEIVPFGLARRLLAVDDDLAYRRAVSLFREAHTGIPSFETSLEGTALRVQAEAALAHVIRAGGDPARASTAANLLGVLAVADATSASEGATPIERSIFEFVDAVHLDPADEPAKANLELVYQLKAPPNSLRGNARRPGKSHSGASATAPGHGY